MRISEIASGLMGTNNHGVLLFAWVLLLRKLVVTMLISTIIYGVLVIDGYLFQSLWYELGLTLCSIVEIVR